MIRAEGAAEKFARFEERMIRARAEGRCQGVDPSDHTLDCPHPPVARVHVKTSMELPALKCQYHLDVCMEFVRGAIDRIEIPMTHVISKNVKCPWCGAEPGEDCTEGGPDGRPQVLPHGHGHVSRLERVERAAESS